MLVNRCIAPLGLALKKTAQELDKAVAEATPYEPAGKAQTATTEGKKESAGAYRHLLTGVSYMLPMVVAGGLCIALSFAFGIEAFKEPGTLAAALMQIGGGSAFALMVWYWQVILPSPLPIVRASRRV